MPGFGLNARVIETVSYEISNRKNAHRLLTRAEFEVMHGNLTVAEDLLREAVAELERTCRQVNTDLAVAMHSLATVLEPQGKLIEAGKLREQVTTLLAPPQ
ncbi:MAG TPA: hypothetical protein V6D17_11820 [Candidatus Obscuribacterales bacterium]